MNKDHKTLLLATLDQHGACDVEVHGRSMWPFVRDGDTVSIEAGFRHPARGMVIAFFDHDRLVVHRILGYQRKNGNGWTLRVHGDSSPASVGDIDSTEVIGIVRSLKRGGRSSRKWFRVPGCYLCLAAGLTIQALLTARGFSGKNPPPLSRR